MSRKFDEAFKEFNAWYKKYRLIERGTDLDLEFIQDSLDRTIKLIEIATEDLARLEKGSVICE